MNNDKPIGYYDHELEWKTKPSTDVPINFDKMKAEMLVELEKIKQYLVYHGYGCAGYYSTHLLKKMMNQ
jgi:hypothetical protein